MMRFFLTFLLFYGSIALSGQCLMQNLKVNKTSCDQRGKFYISIDFQHTAASKAFSVSGNGKNYGNFNYSALPVQLGPFDADCITSYEFAIRDSLTTSCFLYQNIGKHCCPDLCKVRIKDFGINNCVNQLYDINLALQSFASGGKYDIYYDQKKILSDIFTDEKINVSKLASSPINTFHSIIVCAADEKICCDTIRYANPCFCNVTNVKTSVVNCDMQKKMFDVVINFDHKATSDSFRLGGNSTNYGTFAYKNLPVTLKNLPILANRSYEFLVLDKNDAFCFGSVVLGVVDSCIFNCDISGIKIAPLFCTDSVLTIGLGLTATYYGVSGATIIVDGQVNSQIRYENATHLIDLPKKLCGQQYNFKIFDNAMPTCSSQFVYKSDTCCHKPCVFSNDRIKEQCTPQGLEFLELDFEFQGQSDSFLVLVNNASGVKYAYTDLPVKIFDADKAGQSFIISIKDVRVTDCSIELPYSIKCEKQAPCKISDFKVSAASCDSTKHFKAEFSFSSENTSSSYFLLSVNGSQPDTFSYGMDKYLTGPLKGDCSTIYNFIVRDTNDSLCAASFTFSDTICCRWCILSDPQIIYLPCDNGKYATTVNFQYKDSNQYFTLKVTGRSDTILRYADLPIRITDLEHLRSYDISVRDSMSVHCKLDLNQISKDCPSSVAELLTIPSIFFNGNVVQVEAGDFFASFTVSIHDIGGKSHYYSQVQDRVEVDMSSWPKGIYMCQIRMSGRVYNVKLVKFV